MPEYNDEKRGVLFRNDRKERAEHPDYKGHIVIEGVKYWLSAWVNEIKSGENAGKKMLKMSATPPRDEGRADPKPTPEEKDGDQDDLPF